ncbi:hypothetical protein TWF696_006775 [Orbilia brochopaga]|uniref:L-tyrosine decarboxylase C-terminal domain-containing protein n=1 Tax=Orbilia brochopaga TaxID=3140254 RepID=A0AAV9UW31_9PEZI
MMSKTFAASAEFTTENTETDAYDAVHSYFIGPKGVNLPDFRANINTILDELLEARWNYFPADNKFISAGVRRSKKFQTARDDLNNAVRKVAQLLGEHSVPFWSPRYQAHMCTDLTMPSMLGYFMTMLYNPNNVALEASPITTLAELRVGKQLCKLFGYNVDDTETKLPLGWGHITCDGTVANLESIWVARNLKFYPLALFMALKKGKLKFIGNKFLVQPCKTGSAEKPLIELQLWELLNLRPETVLDLPAKLNKEFGISSEFLAGALEEYNIQTVGRGPLEEYFAEHYHEPIKPMRYFAAKTRHYSWPKSAAIAGLGSDCIFGIEVDPEARIDLVLLKKELLKCIEEKRAVYAVVPIVGTTEEGAVDRLSEIVEMRKQLQDEHGLSFLIHADAAWGGYFATMLRRPTLEVGVQATNGHAKKQVPTLWLKTTTEEDLFALKDADSITVDPHKAGYIPYPAGSLVYRDGRMRHLVTWSSPYLSQGSAENIGIYGVEGSKPGAAAMSTWFSNQTIGLTPEGYGTLLGEAAYTSSRLSAYWATLKTDYFVCVPLNKLPAEVDGHDFDSPEAERDKKYIRENIIGKENNQIKKEQRDVLRKLGSDLNINAFTINWYYENGSLNKDVEEANYLMKRVVDQMSITSANTNPSKIAMFLTSTKFAPKDYGQCAQHLMERMGLDKCEQSLFVLRNVVMSPFPTQTSFLDDMMKDFKELVKKEVEVCRRRNHRGEHRIWFLMQGSPDQVFLVLQTSFHSATRRQQLIFTAELDDELKDFYKKLRDRGDEEGGQDPTIMLESAKPLDIEAADDSLTDENPRPFKFSGKVYVRGYAPNSKTGNVTLTSVVKSRPLNTANQDVEYPAEFTPFYLYGTAKEQHISHMLVRAPNIALSASNLVFEPELPSKVCDLLSHSRGLILGLMDIPEASRQPFPMENKSLRRDLFFKKDETFNVKIWDDCNPVGGGGPNLLDRRGDLLHECKMTLGKYVVVDAEGPNKDRFSRINVDSDSWQKELDKIGNILSGEYRAEEEDDA